MTFLDDDEENLLNEYCPHCGKYTGGDTYCPECGKEIFDDSGLEEHHEDEEEGGVVEQKYDE